MTAPEKRSGEMFDLALTYLISSIYRKLVPMLWTVRKRQSLPAGDKQVDNQEWNIADRRFVVTRAIGVTHPFRTGPYYLLWPYYRPGVPNLTLPTSILFPANRFGARVLLPRPLLSQYYQTTNYRTAEHYQ
jgi:hypothetical protein